jgi:phosphoribosylaminoimidazole-succinocarboxamide synthase
MPDAMLQSDLPFPVRRGKVRDVYDLGDHVLLVATDRVSAFDVVMAEPIPGKGEVLTAISTHFFKSLAAAKPNHVLETDVEKFPTPLKPFAEILRGRSTLCRKATVVPIECVVRGYLAGSGYAEYARHGTLAGEKLPAGLRRGDKLPEPVFTPATKADAGHDENITYVAMEQRIGHALASQLRQRSLHLFEHASEFTRSRGLILADTKFEFGVLPDGKMLLVDEILTPDSSRYWDAATYRPGEEPAAFDKQPLRDWLETQSWDKQPPPPSLPKEVVDATAARYRAARERLVG